MAKANETSRAVKENQIPNAKPKLNVFVATQKTQGQRKNDFCHAIEGEIVRVGSQCDRERVDGRCGCRRCLVGLQSGKGTTTFLTVEQEITESQLIEMVRQSLETGGWLKFMTADDVKEEARQILTLAKPFPVGSVVERRGDIVQQRC